MALSQTRMRMATTLQGATDFNYHFNKIKVKLNCDGLLERAVLWPDRRGTADARTQCCACFLCVLAAYGRYGCCTGLLTR